jgi:hypothetical protein
VAEKPGKQMISKYLIVPILFLVTATLSGQVLSKGAVVECSEMSVDIHQGATMDQYCHILLGQYAPAAEKAFPGSTVFFAKGARGDAESKLGSIRVFKSTEIRDRYFDAQDHFTESGQQAIKTLSPIIDQLDQLGTTSRKITNWIIVNEPRAGLVLQKGGSFGLHLLTVTLADGVTMDQFLEFMSDRYVPALVSQFTDLEVLIMKPLEETREKRIAYVNYFESESSRDSYWPEPDTPSEGVVEAQKKVQSIMFELLELGTWTDEYGVWVMQ